jgi:hypothetical protein
VTYLEIQKSISNVENYISISKLWWYQPMLTSWEGTKGSGDPPSSPRECSSRIHLTCVYFSLLPLSSLCPCHCHHAHFSHLHFCNRVPTPILSAASHLSLCSHRIKLLPFLTCYCGFSSSFR